MNSPEVTLPANGVELDRLVRAVWSAAFRSGYANGSDDATAYEWGTRRKAKTPEKAWEEDVQWMIETDTNAHLDIGNPAKWADVP